MSEKVSILDYGIGNVKSLQNGLSKNKLESIITSNKDDILSSKMLIVPGVGSFKGCISSIKSKNLDKIIYEFAETEKTLVGICVGMQILFDIGFEFGKTKGLGLIKGEVRKFNFKTQKSILLPHIGWNGLKIKKSDKIIKQTNEQFYFIHSYICVPFHNEDILSTTKYENVEFVSSIKKSNIYGFQFHPEKSSNQGLKILKRLYQCA